MILFALDQNFPTPIVHMLGEYMTEGKLVSIRDIDPRFATLEDWQVLLALHHHKDGYAGLITTDSNMLKLPREMCVLRQTQLSLVVAEAAGHDPLKATGLLLTHFEQIAKRSANERGVIWELRAGDRKPKKPDEFLAGFAKRADLDPKEFIRKNKLSDVEMAKNPLASLAS